MKICTIYCDHIRKDTTGFYVTKAFKSLGHEVFHSNPMISSIPNGYDMYVLVDDGIPYKVEGHIGSLVYWAIDTHITYDQCIDKSKNANFIFAAQKDGAERLKKDTAKDVLWLPLACDREIHSAEINIKYDVCFVGNTNPKLMEKRIEVIDAVFKEFPNFYFGQRFFNEMSAKFAESKIVLNHSINNDINMRVFEAMCSGSVLATDSIKELDDIGIKDGVNCITYSDIECLKMKIKYLLENENDRLNIAKAGREFALNNTYEDRCKKILEVFGGKK